MHLTVPLMFITDLSCERVWPEPSSAKSSHILAYERKPSRQAQFKVQKQDFTTIIDLYFLLQRSCSILMLAVFRWCELGMN